MSAKPPEPADSDAILARLLSLHPKLIDLSLGRLQRLLSALGHPERALPSVIHVAGTNGKGSLTAYLRAGLEATGARVHVYTSPHLMRFHERIRLAGALIEEDALAAYLARAEAANGAAPITFFEITTAAAFLAFAETPADYTLLEVGLGGRLDATNVIDTPRLTAITPIGMDHQEFLGDTLGAIAAEKAGILKTGAPSVVAAQAPEAQAVIERRAAEVGAPLISEGVEWRASEERGRLVFEDERGLLDLPPPALAGRHQIGNAGLAVAALRALDLDEAAIAAGVAGAAWPGRLQRLRVGGLVAEDLGADVWLDGGHNPAAAEVVAAHMGALEEGSPAPLHLICGMLGTKDVEGFLAPFQGLVRRVYAVSIPGEANALAPERIAAAAVSAGLQAQIAGSVGAALRLIGAEAREAGGASPPRVLICGSLYLAGWALRENGEEMR
ncbi:MAG: folylpolyglutamate synthase/dihydrofolate synthase family protein [Pseudomonadota bacterium]